MSWEQRAQRRDRKRDRAATERRVRHERAGDAGRRRPARFEGVTVSCSGPGLVSPHEWCAGCWCICHTGEPTRRATIADAWHQATRRQAVEP